MGGGKRGKKVKNAELGRALEKASNRGRPGQRQAQTLKEHHALQRTEEPKDLNAMQSSVEPSNMADFLATAELKNDDFESQKQNTIVIESNAFVQVRHEPSEEQLARQREFWNTLRVPRRPKWTRDMDASVLHQQEANSFLDWRRNLSRVEELDNIQMTPFEKNLNVWRQLWRVVEMSNVLVQIVDARDPELFRCSDLETYTKEVGSDKMSVLLLNKADLLTANQRRVWASYYESIGVKFFFFSAKQVERTPEAKDDSNDGDESDEKANAKDNDENDASSSDGNEEEKQEEEEEERQQQRHHGRSKQGDPRSLDDAGYSDEGDNDDSDEEIHEEPWSGKVEDIVGRRELIQLLHAIHKEHFPDVEKLNVGFCGYPNVGKSSTINKLMGEKRVTVSATPGKTKHFQSLFLEDDLCVLDCPGLVFPNFVTNKATMVCSGLLPIDQMRDFRSPGSVVCQRIKLNVLEAQYGIILPDPDLERGVAADTPPSVDELFAAYAYVRGFFGASGAPNQSRAARVILKDYVNGVLRYVAAPPGELGKDFDPREGQEDAVRKKLDFAERHARNANGNAAARTPTFQEYKPSPQVKADELLVSHRAVEAGRKNIKTPADKRKIKKRRGKGKRKGDIEFPYGVPPDPY